MFRRRFAGGVGGNEEGFGEGADGDRVGRSECPARVFPPSSTGVSAPLLQQVRRHVARCGVEQGHIQPRASGEVAAVPGWAGCKPRSERRGGLARDARSGIGVQEGRPGPGGQLMRAGRQNTRVQRLVAALVLNTKKRFVVHIDYRDKNGVKKSTKPAHFIPKNIDLDDMTRIYISAIGGHSTRRVPVSDTPTGVNPKGDNIGYKGGGAEGRKPLKPLKGWLRRLRRGLQGEAKGGLKGFEGGGEGGLDASR